MKRASLCSISKNVSARCEICKKQAEPVHIVLHPHPNILPTLTQLMCADCCPEHAVPPLHQADAEPWPPGLRPPAAESRILALSLLVCGTERTEGGEIR